MGLKDSSCVCMILCSCPHCPGVMSYLPRASSVVFGLHVVPCLVWYLRHLSGRVSSVQREIEGVPSA